MLVSNTEVENNCLSVLTLSLGTLLIVLSGLKTLRTLRDLIVLRLLPTALEPGSLQKKVNNILLHYLSSTISGN